MTIDNRQEAWAGMVNRAEGLKDCLFCKQIAAILDEVAGPTMLDGRGHGGGGNA